MLTTSADNVFYTGWPFPRYRDLRHNSGKIRIWAGNSIRSTPQNGLSFRYLHIYLVIFPAALSREFFAPKGALAGNWQGIGREILRDRLRAALHCSDCPCPSHGRHSAILVQVIRVNLDAKIAGSRSPG